MSDQLSQLRQSSVNDSNAPEPYAGIRKRPFRTEVLIGLVLLAVGIIAAFWIRQSDQKTVQVLGVNREFPAGHVFTESDLLPVDVSADVDNQFVPVGSLSQLLGGVLTVDVPAGPLSRAAVREAQQVLLEGEALIASAMDQGTFPPSMSPGDVVAIVTTPSLSAVDGDTKQLDERAVVFSISPQNDFNAKTVVTLRTNVSVAERIAASGPVHLVIVQIGGAQ